MADYLGTTGNDTYTGTVDADTIHDGNGGNDTLSGGDGNDQMTVTGGADTANGDAGSDTLIIQWADLVQSAYVSSGPNANGVLGGWDGQYYGNDGRYVTFSSIERFHVFTGAGSDTITTASGDDVVSAGGSNDVVNVGSGNDTADGGADADQISADLSAATGAIAWNLITNSYSGPMGSFTNFEFFGTVSTGSGNDVLVSGSGTRHETLNTGSGDDSVTVFGGNDSVSLGAGDDTLIIDWTNVFATAYVSSGPNVNGVDGGWDGQFYANDGSYVTFSSVENFHISTSVGGDTITTANGDDVVNSGDGNDLVNVGAGNDTANGEGGIDRISADLSTDSAGINWNLQTNSYSGALGSFTNFEFFGTVSTGTGHDTVVSGLGNQSEAINTGTGDDSVTVFGGSDSVNMGAGSDLLVVQWGDLTSGAYNSSGPNANGVEGGWDGQIYGNDGRAVTYTSVSRFHITTGDGYDTITTMDGDDIVNSGAGNDLINVGSGADVADGGDGADRISANLAVDLSGITWDLQGNSYSGSIGAFTNFESFGTVVTGSGHDTLVSGAGVQNETMDTGQGDDSVSVFGGGDTVTFGAGTDTLIVQWGDLTSAAYNSSGPNANGVDGGWDGQFYGSDGRSVTYTSASHFQLTTGSGNDTLATADGNDSVNSGAGDDLVDVGSGVDNADGGDGADRISANLAAAATAVYWNLSANSYSGPGGFTNFEYFGTITTGIGNDVIVSGSGSRNETVNTGSGGDTVTVFGGGDTANLGAGDDLLIIDWSDIGSSVYNSSGPSVNGSDGGWDGQFYGSDGRSVTYTSANRFDVTSGSGNDTIATAGGADRVNAGAGNDTVSTGDGADIIISGAGNDSYNGGNGRDTLDFSGASSAVNVDLALGTAHDGEGGVDTVADVEILIGSNFGDALTGGLASETFYGGGSGDTMAGGQGGDFYAEVDAADTIVEAAGGGIDTVQSNAAFYALGANVENLIANSIGFTGVGNGLNNYIIGYLGNDVLDGGAGDDLVMGGGYIDTVIGGAGDDIVLGGQLGANLLVNGSFDYQATGVDARTWIMAAPSDYNGVTYRHVDATLSGWLVTAGSVELNTTGTNGDFGTSDGAAAIDMTSVIGGNVTMFQDILGIVDAEPLLLSFDAALPTGGPVSATPDAVLEVYWNGTLVGTITPTTNEMTRYTFLLQGVTSGSGSGGANRLEFREVGSGADARGTILDNVQLNRMEHDGYDDSLLGGDGADMLFGGAGFDTLNGGLGADLMRGALGQDTYYVDDLGDFIVEYGGEGDDLVSTSLNSYTLGSYLEYLNFTGSGDFVGTGNTLNNIINGAVGNDTLNGGDGDDVLNGHGGDDTLTGGAGADSMAGGTGNDLYLADENDLLTELADEGTDTVSTGASAFTLADNLENLAFFGVGNFTGTGNALANVITGVSGNDSLNGLEGDDTLIGQDGDDVLDGGLGVDSMTGGAGNDVYIVDDAADAVVEAFAQGIDRVETSLANYTLGNDVEDLFYTGALAFTGVGNASANYIIGGGFADTLSGLGGNDVIVAGAGNDYIDGGTGDDAMTGGAGNDDYFVDSAGDAVTEATSEGTDSVFTILAAYTLTANVENVTFNGGGNVVGTGNGLANQMIGGTGNDSLNGEGGVDALYGADGDDVLNGGTGADTMVGGTGNDSYTVDNAGDVVTEQTGEGTDTVSSGISYTLGVNVENLILAGGAAAGTGNSLGNVITGNNVANTLNGGDGDDALSGNAGSDTLIGGAGDDSLNGGSGIDSASGGAGNDTYFVNLVTDTVTELAGEGTDTVYSSSSEFTLSTNVENIVLQGASASRATGNTAANSMTGNTGANTLAGLAGNDVLSGGLGNDKLIGGAGSDLLTGGLGNDVYQIVDSLDTVTELLGEGTDIVQAYVNYTLGANVERLYLYGSAVSGTGNELANIIVGTGAANTLNGKAANDVLYGGAGNDSISGGAGRDRLYGEAGADVFVFDDGDFGGVSSGTADVIHDFSLIDGDTIDLSAVDAITGGGDDGFTFIGAAAFSGAAGELRVQTSTTSTIVMGDMDGNGIADFWIVLSGVHALDVSDFWL